MFASDQEFQIAKDYTENHAFPGFSKEQIKEILNDGRRLHKWYKEHPRTHTAISAAVVIFVLACEVVSLLLLPYLFKAFGLLNETSSIVLSALVVGLVNGAAITQIGVYSIHEGAAHDVIGGNTGPIGRLVRFVGRNMSRLHFADPIYYAHNHLSHHANFATKKDATFTNFVMPEKFLWCLVPMSFVLNINPYRIHTGQTYTKSRIVSEIIAIAYRIGVLAFMIPHFGLLFSLLTVLLIGPTVAFFIDRLRESTEHNLMPLSTFDGTRQLGLGFWGLLIGGGPWGQPCHMSHHFYASLPWYGQLGLHRKIREVMTPVQREYFLVEGFWAFPRLVVDVIVHSVRLSRGEQDQSQLVPLSMPVTPNRL